MARCLRFVSLPKSIIDDNELLEQMLKDKEVEYQELIKLLEKHKCKSCLSHLQNAYPNMFTNFSNQWSGKTTSLIERIMRTVNLRANVGKWSTKGVLNTMKIRLAYYYNGFNPQLKHQSVSVSRLITNSA